MSSGPFDTYLQALERALRARGYAPSRIVDEAREHLADAVEDGLRRGLARENAEREALERFGPPELIAAQAPARNFIMARLTDALDTIVGHWRWVTAATAVAALLTGVASSYLPTRYQSATVILVTPQPAPPDHAEATRQTRDRLRQIGETILTGPRLDGIAKDFGLAEAGLQMRRNISVELLTPEQPEHTAASGVFRVSFSSPDPRLSMKVTERLASLFVEENLRLHQSSGRGAGELFRVVEPARVPDRPVGPSRLAVNAAGAFAGLTLAIAALIWRRSPAAN